MKRARSKKLRLVSGQRREVSCSPSMQIPAPSPAPYRTPPHRPARFQTGLAEQLFVWHSIKKPRLSGVFMTGATGLEPATSGLTVRCSNQAELHPPGPDSPGQSVGGDRFELPAPCL